MEEQTRGLQDYLGILRRRKKQILTVAGILLLISVIVALSLPPSYRSTATILIEEQEIPTDLVRSTINGYADQRVQVITQQVMTRANMMQIIEKYDLYAKQRKHDTSEEVLKRMSNDIHFNLISADVVDRRSGAKTVATIAFTLAYDGETPDKAQKVDSELTTLYLNQNLKTRQEQSAETSTFLTAVANQLSAHISDIEAKLAAFKAKNVGRLPELATLNLQMRDRTDTQIMNADQQINALVQNQYYLEGQLAQLNPNTPMISSSGERILGPSDQLKTLEAQYASMSGAYAPDYPDVVKMRKEIAALKKVTGNSNASDEQAKQLTGMYARLAVLREKYSDDYPDVVTLKKSIAALEKAQQKSAASGVAPTIQKPENPAYITLQSQLESTRAQLKSLRANREQLKSQMESYETDIAQAPQVEREYLDLNRDHENSLKSYQDIKAKQLDARVSQEMEKDSKGERFSLIDPPDLPQKPHSPNRPAILFLGLILSLGGGLGYAGIRESMDSSVKSARGLAGLLSAPLLSVIPYMENVADRRKKSLFRLSLVVMVLVAIVVALLLINWLWMPLDVLWYSLLRKLGM